MQRTVISVNNKEAVKKISEAGATCDFLYADAGQDIMAFYLPMADSISAKNATAEDQNINASWATQVKEYAAGNKDKVLQSQISNPQYMTPIHT